MNPLFPELDTAAIAEGDRRRDEALDRVNGNTPPTWRGWAEQAVRYVAERRMHFTTDPVWAVLASWAVGPPPEPRAMGPLMKYAASQRWCESTGETVMSTRPNCHRRPIAVYRSRLYRKVAT